MLEADKFPRYHVGESQLASLPHFLRFIDLDKEFDEFGFNRKNGAAFKLNIHNREGYTNFVAQDPKNYSWNVTRAESDVLMLRHSENCGALVFEETKVLSFDFEGDGDARRPVAAHWKTKSGETGKISFDFVVDASGRAGLLSTRAFNTRVYNSHLKNVASWGYWRGAGSYASEDPVRKGSPFFEALTDESGWAWFIPLQDGVTSVGVVMNQAISIEKKGKMAESDSLSFYHHELSRAPHIMALLVSATLVTDKGPVIRSASDYSYSATSYAGPGYRIVGDAAAFIDPFFSSGVHLALSGALSAAASICSSIRGDLSETDAYSWHNVRVGTSYTRFLVVVLSAYSQMTNQGKPVLSNVNEADFDRAFGHFRSIIQGKTDTTQTNQDELRATIQFCTAAFDSTNPQAQATARSVMRTEDTLHIDHLVADQLNGFSLRLERGYLGLEKC